MEILSEFDNESPLYVSFCKRISPEDFERQSLTCTQKALRELYVQMEQNPDLCASVVQKRKQLDSKEDAGLVSYIKAKFSSLFRHEDSLKMEDIQQEVKQLKWEMQKVNNYALAAKKASYLTLEGRTGKNFALGTFNPSQAGLGEPVLPTMPKIFGPFPSQAERLTCMINVDLKQASSGMSPVSPKRDTTNSPHPTGSLPNANQASSPALNPAALANPRSFKEDCKENNNPDVDSRSTGS